MKKIYTCFCTDVIHEGHLNVLNEASKYGEVIVGVLSDQAVIKYLRFFTIDEKERVKMIENLPNVSKVVLQNNIFYDEIFDELKPDFVMQWGHAAT